MVRYDEDHRMSNEPLLLENAPYCPPTVDPELRHWYAVEVTHVKTPGEFYIRYPFGIDNSLGQGRERT
jgi:hypothetical protein